MDELPPLLPCPMCGNEDGYTLESGETHRWWNMRCKGCGRTVDECRSNGDMSMHVLFPTHWPAADEAWNEAGAYAAAAVAREREKWEAAMKQTWCMVDPFNPAGVPGSYARGQDSGIVAALTTVRANYIAAAAIRKGE